MRIQRVYSLLVLSVLFFCASPQAAQPPRLMKGYAYLSAIWPKSSDGITRIPVCWLNPEAAPQRDRDWVRNVVRRTWEAASLVRFTGWGECPDDAESFNGVTMEIGSEAPAHTDGLGRFIDNGPYGGDDDHTGGIHGMYLPFYSPGLDEHCNLAVISRQQCIENLGVHEFGHVLGYLHEHMRGDTPDGLLSPDGVLLVSCANRGGSEFRMQGGNVLVGGWDVNSIMNYCKFGNPNHQSSLSRIDQHMVKGFYGNTPTINMDDRSIVIPVVVVGTARYSARMVRVGSRWRVKELQRVSQRSASASRYSSNTLTIPFISAYRDMGGQQYIANFYRATLRRDADGLFSLVSARLLPD